MLTNEIFATSVAIVIAYLLGSLPIAYLVARSVGIDIFEIGTGNPGTANVFRMVGRRLGAVVFILDIGKGAAGVLVAVALGTPSELVPIVALLPVVGHFWPVFLKFRGGAGLAAGLGAACALVGVWAILPIVLGLVALAVVRESGRAGAATFISAAAIAIIDGPNYPALVGIQAIVILLLTRLVLVEMPTNVGSDSEGSDSSQDADPSRG